MSQFNVASHSRFVTVFSVCKVSLQSFDITPPKSVLSIIIIIIIIIITVITNGYILTGIS